MIMTGAKAVVECLREQGVEVIFGYPLDIEWIVSKNQIWIVQARRITSYLL